MRRRKPETHANHERWLVSYADFITLLFAFFVVMFASTQADKTKAKAVSDSVREALEHGQFSSAISVVLGRGKHQASTPPTDQPKPEAKENQPQPQPAKERPADLVDSLATLNRGLDAELKTGKVRMRLEARGLVISLREAAFFAPGGDAVAPAGMATIGKIAAVAQGVPNPLRLEGHTDSTPIHNSRFRSNWELSAARAIAMMELFSQRFGVPAGRMSVAGYAEFAPDDDNATVEGRAHNRRVDVVVLSAEGAKAEPVAQAGPGASAP